MEIGLTEKERIMKNKNLLSLHKCFWVMISGFLLLTLSAAVEKMKLKTGNQPLHITA